MKNKIIKPKYLIFYSIFIFSLSIINFCSAKIEIPLTGLPANPTIMDYIKTWFDLGLGIGGLLSFIMLVIGGIEYMVSTGNPEKMSDSISRIKGSFLGLVLLLGSYFIMQTINSSLIDLNITAVKRMGTIYLTGISGGPQPGPLDAPDTSRLPVGSSGLLWPSNATQIDSSAPSETLCASDDMPYFVYTYPSLNFMDQPTYQILKCGQNISLSSAKSYRVRKITPGVYFYPSKDCQDNSPKWPEVMPIGHTESMPDPCANDYCYYTASKIGSFRIVTGPNQHSGPFYGVMFFEQKGYYGRFYHYRAIKDPNNYDNCTTLPSGGNEILQYGSIAIYQWSGVETPAPFTAISSGTGIDLFTKPNWTGGRETISDSAITKGSGVIGGTRGEPLSRELVSISPNYTNTNVPAEEQALCPEFGEHRGLFSNTKCLESIKINGNYLVIISDDQDPLPGASGLSGPPKGELFPNPQNQGDAATHYNYSVQEGPLDLNNSAFQSVTTHPFGLMSWIEIIPGKQL